MQSTTLAPPLPSWFTRRKHNKQRTKIKQRCEIACRTTLFLPREGPSIPTATCPRRCGLIMVTLLVGKKPQGLGLCHHFILLLPPPRTSTLSLNEGQRHFLPLPQAARWLPLLEKEDRQAAGLSLNCCVHMGGGDAAWLRHRWNATSRWATESGSPHGARS